MRISTLAAFAVAMTVVPLAGAAGDAPVRLAFADVYARPVGPYGLELSSTVIALDGKRVRVTGYVVAEETPVPGRFLLSPVPVSLSDAEDGPADDLPPAVIYVTLPETDAVARVAFQRAPLELTGVLHVGNRVETDRRVSLLRLSLDPRGE